MPTLVKGKNSKFGYTVTYEGPKGKAHIRPLNHKDFKRIMGDAKRTLKALKQLQGTSRQRGTPKRINKHKLKEFQKKERLQSIKRLKDTVRIGDRVQLYEAHTLKGTYIVATVPDMHKYLLVDLESGNCWHVPFRWECARVSPFNIPLSVLLGAGIELNQSSINTLGAYKFTSYKAKEQVAGITRIVARSRIDLR
jgi:hypothetical protein